MGSEFDILSDVLESLRVCGSLLLHEAYTAPWRIALPQGEQLGHHLNVQAGTKVVPFHLVERGYIELTAEAGLSTDRQPLVIEAGEMVICFNGTSHCISQGANPVSFPVADFFAGKDFPFRCGISDRSASALCLCGVFYLHDTHLNPLLASLPPILHASVAQAETFQNLSGVAHLIAQEVDQRSPGHSFMVERLLELLCAGAIRSYIKDLPTEQSSWLMGLQDPVVSRALTMIHAQPNHDWSVDRLAHNVELSPSRFSARFKETVGQSPMSYVAKWRIHVASRLLKETKDTVSDIALKVGYENLAAFNRAFKRHLDVPPGVWRSRHCS